MARLLAGIERVERWVCVGAFTLLAAVLFGDVLSRELTGAGLHWSGRIGVLANVLLVMAGFGLATASDSHLRPRFVDDLWARVLPEAWLPAGESLQYLIAAVVNGLLAWAAAHLVYESWEFGEKSLMLGWPVWVLQIWLPLAFLACSIRNLAYTFLPGLRPAEPEAAA